MAKGGPMTSHSKGEEIQYKMEYNYPESPSKNPIIYQWGLKPASQDC